MRVDYRLDDSLEISRDQNVGKTSEKCAKASVALWRRGELLGANLVRPALDWNSANLREIRFLVYRWLVGGVYDFR